MDMGVSDNTRGLLLAMVSSLFIGTSFIFKKKGLLRAAAAGTRAGVGGYTYLLEPLWWAGMISMIVGEIANFVAYIYAPAVLVTPLGALSIIVSTLSAEGAAATDGNFGNYILHSWVGSFLIYVAASVSLVLLLIVYLEPLYGQTNILVYLGICSILGAITVMSVKAVGIAIKLTLEGINQFGSTQTWFFLSVAVFCLITQLNYLNKALDTFNAAIVSPIHYVMFTTLTIIASSIMFKDWSGQNASSITSEVCGFITVLSGTIILHMTREEEASSPPTGTIVWYDGDSSKALEGAHFISLHSSDYFELVSGDKVMAA
ncbi:hypothetical protein SASPL_118119 [Salvia splendens]|uniref:Probable magnesium transporter n=1 Tax=Salvia splendens TaxID=180675 RepID=A0A8X8ZWY3_SALSN|nr:hypothetical protein SASPL_118119 [Salvia splendens]